MRKYQVFEALNIFICCWRELSGDDCHYGDPLCGIGKQRHYVCGEMCAIVTSETA